MFLQTCSLHQIKRLMIMNINQQVAAMSAGEAEQGEAQISAKCADLAYLCHFIQCYEPSLQILNRATWPVYVIEDRETKIGIAFCDLQTVELISNQNSAVIDNVVYPDPGTVFELWLVFVVGNIQQHQSIYQELVIEHKLTEIFDNIFLFDFYQSAIQLIS
jgi:hypothetical protein